LIFILEFFSLDFSDIEEYGIGMFVLVSYQINSVNVKNIIGLAGTEDITVGILDF